MPSSPPSAELVHVSGQHSPFASGQELACRGDVPKGVLGEWPHFQTFFPATTVGATVFDGGGVPFFAAASLVAIWRAVALALFSDVLNVLVLKNVLHCLKALLQSQDAVVDVHDLLVTLRHRSQQRLLRNTRDRRLEKAVERLLFSALFF